MFFRFEIIRIRIIKVMLLQWEINCKSASEGIYEKREYFFYKKYNKDVCGTYGNAWLSCMRGL